MKKIFLILSIILLGSCTTSKFSNLTYTNTHKEYNVITSFDETIMVSEFLGSAGGPNIGNISAEIMDGRVETYIKDLIAGNNGDAAINVSITQYATTMDVILNIITTGIYAPVTIRITGDIVSYL